MCRLSPLLVLTLAALLIGAAPAAAEDGSAPERKTVDALIADAFDSVEVAPAEPEADGPGSLERALGPNLKLELGYRRALHAAQDPDLRDPEHYVFLQVVARL